MLRKNSNTPAKAINDAKLQRKFKRVRSKHLFVLPYYNVILVFFS